MKIERLTSERVDELNPTDTSVGMPTASSPGECSPTDDCSPHGNCYPKN
jgi:hypothetical protein